MSTVTTLPGVLSGAQVTAADVLASASSASCDRHGLELRLGRRGAARGAAHRSKADRLLGGLADRGLDRYGASHLHGADGEQDGDRDDEGELDRNAAASIADQPGDRRQNAAHSVLSFHHITCRQDALAQRTRTTASPSTVTSSSSAHGYGRVSGTARLMLTRTNWPGAAPPGQVAVQASVAPAVQAQKASAVGRDGHRGDLFRGQRVADVLLQGSLLRLIGILPSVESCRAPAARRRARRR